MATGPRLEFRQTQSLVMTPQLRQAIKLLQFSNIEVNAFVEEELERNPLLERDERSDAVPELPAPDQRTLAENPAAEDAASLLRMEKLPDAVESDTTNVFDHGGSSDGYAQSIGPGGRDSDDERGIDDLAASPRNLRAHLDEQLRLSFRDPQGPHDRRPARRRCSTAPAASPSATPNSPPPSASRRPRSSASAPP